MLKKPKKIAESSAFATTRILAAMLVAVGVLVNNLFWGDFTLNDYLRKIDNKPVARVQTEESGICPAVIRNKVGIFNQENSDSKVKDKFPDTVLLVTANYAYYNMLQNWEWLANELGLQWAVLALDERLFNELGPERAVAPDEKFAVSGQQIYRNSQFHTLSCNKMNMALEVANNCGVNVVFTDTDNVFLKNPFEHDLGKMIRSNVYDYVYQTNNFIKKERDHRCIRGYPDGENNTGFYYIRHGNEIYKRVVEATMTKCHHPKNTIDDQTLFWNAFHEVKEEVGDGSFHHCGSYNNEWNQAFDMSEEENDSVFKYCCMDPYYYPIGRSRVPDDRDIVTFHANWIRGYNAKVNKLREIKDGYGWNITRFIDGKGDLLTD